MRRLQLSVRRLLLITACSAVAVRIASPFFLEGRVDEKLRSRVTSRFNDAPLSHALSVLSRDAGVRITVDSQGLAKENVAPSTPVTLNLTQPISLKSTLILMLEPLRLGFIKQGQGLVVTSDADVPYTTSASKWCGTGRSLAETTQLPEFGNAVKGDRDTISEH